MNTDASAPALCDTAESCIREATEFLSALFAPDDLFLHRPIEAWIEDGKKQNRVDYKGIRYMRLNGCAGVILYAANKRCEAKQTNFFFGVCPRVGPGGRFDQAWQIRTIRCLWADVDACIVEEARQRCLGAGLPEPSIIVASGNGAHIYWLLDEPYIIDDAPQPVPVFTEFVDQGPGKKKKVRKYIRDPASREHFYLDIRANMPALSEKAQLVQDVLKGIAAKIGGDHTTDLSRILRLPGTMNRKDQRNGREPVPCKLVKCDPNLRYPFSDFAQLAEESPDRKRREQIRQTKLPTHRKLSPSKQDKFNELMMICVTAPVGSRSEHDYRLCAFAIESGMSRADVWAAVSKVGKFADDERYFDRTWTAAEEDIREKAFERATAKAQKTSDRRSSKPASKPEREIIIGTDESRVIDEAAKALGTCQNIYQRGGTLVQIVDGGKPPKGIARSKDAPHIAIAKSARIRELLADAAVWLRPAEEDKFEPVHPPEWAVKGLEARGQWPNIRHLEAVAESPVLRANGTVLQMPGYDVETGIMFLPDGKFQPVSEIPSRDDAIRSKDALLEVVEDFPFAGEAHRSAWLASVLTPLARYAFDGPSPLFHHDANVRGCGKSLLTDATAIITTGRPMARMSLPRDDDEIRKRITALALAGEPEILIDNIAGSFGSPSLDAALTATSWSDRILGQTAMAAGIPLYATWYATGNNVVLVGDTARRVVYIRLESPEENPEERGGFTHPDLLGWVRQERPRLIAAALTILAGYCAAGRPDLRLTPWGSYEAWSGLVRQAVAWTGMPDPAVTRAELASQSDREAVALRRLIAGWEEIAPMGRGMTVAAVLRELATCHDQYDALRDALFELAPPRDGKTLNPRSVGMKLHHLRRRVVGGKFLDRKDNRDNSAVWAVFQTGTTGTTGTSRVPTRARQEIAQTKEIAHRDGAENSPRSAPSPRSCAHDDVAETPTFDGYVNRQCRVCGAELSCRRGEAAER